MDIPSNAVTKLRILTKKSKMGFGKFADMTVSDILIAKKDYIPFVYYNIAPVSFSDDIIDELKMVRIAKPGTNKDIWYAYKKAISDQFTPEQREHGRFKMYQNRKSIGRAALARAIKAEDSSRGARQTKNQGR